MLLRNLALIAAHVLTVVCAHAAQFGEYEYTNHGATVAIVSYYGNATGHVTIPSKIDGRPVTCISGFSYCRLTSVTIPSSVTTIGGGAFANCIGLTSVTIPSNVTTIEHAAFAGCIGLTSVTIPSKVHSIGGGAFVGCPCLEKATFLGDAPQMGDYGTDGSGSVFKGASDSFRIFFMDGNRGFSVPTWWGYQTAARHDGPEISLPHGSSCGFWATVIGKGASRVRIPIANIGTEPLTGLVIKIDGRNAKEFIVTQPRKSSLASGESTSFSIKFKPTAKGYRRAVIHIRSNDADENPFELKLNGTAVKKLPKDWPWEW